MANTYPTQFLGMSLIVWAYILLGGVGGFLIGYGSNSFSWYTIAGMVIAIFATGFGMKQNLVDQGWKKTSELDGKNN